MQMKTIYTVYNSNVCPILRYIVKPSITINNKVPINFVG